MRSQNQNGQMMEKIRHLSATGYFRYAVCLCAASAAAAVSPPVMRSISLKWDFDGGLDGWAQSTAMEMGVEVDAINGYLRGMVLPSARMAQAYVDSPELRVEIDSEERDHLVLRMKYLGQCDRAVLALERNPDETTGFPGIRSERRAFRDPVNIPFQPRTSSSLEDELYVFPIWQHVTDTIHRVRIYPCTKVPSAATRGDAVPWSGQTFHIDWVAFAKAPVITKVRGCIDQYYQAEGSVAAMNCSEIIRKTNGVHTNSAFACGAMELPFAATYNCLREGGQRIVIHGKHFGSSDAIVTVDGQACTDIVHAVPEVELECTLPPVTSQWRANPTYPSLVKVSNGRLHALSHEVSFLSYAAPVAALGAPIPSNVAAHAIDVNWVSSPNVWEAMTITGYRVEWKRCKDAAFDPRDVVIVGNVTSTTIVQLRNGADYHARVTALTEDYRARLDWQSIDLYGRRRLLTNGVSGIPSPLSSCVTTLTSDFSFPQFSARLLTNVSASTTPVTMPTRGPSGEIGDQGHFGLYLNGDANVQNCNATATCCDGFNTLVADSTASCSLVCSVTESRTSTYINGRTNRSIATNAPGALPGPAKVVQPFATVNAGTAIAPTTAACGPALRLTASASFLTGSAWYPRQMNVREGFDTTFSFRMSNPSTTCKIMDDTHTRCRSRGGDGFAFVIQNNNEISLGDGGMELGYGNLKSTLAVEFDTWYNHEQLDAYENHISIHVGRGSEAVYANHTYSLGSTSTLPDLTDGVHAVRILYDPNIDENLLFGEYFTATTLVGDFLSRGDWLSGLGTLSVFLDDLNSPVLAVPLRLDDTINLNHGRAWVGFTASTGGVAYQTHDILSWTFESLRREITRVEPVVSVGM